MKLRTKAVWSLAVACCMALLLASPAAAQTITTGNITGTISDAQGGVLPGATVTALHTDTGTSYEAVTGTDGRFTILNVRVGTYTVAVNMSGFKDQKQEKVAVELGAERTVDFKLQLASVSETVRLGSKLGTRLLIAQIMQEYSGQHQHQLGITISAILNQKFLQVGDFVFV